MHLKPLLSSFIVQQLKLIIFFLRWSRLWNTSFCNWKSFCWWELAVNMRLLAGIGIAYCSPEKWTSFLPLPLISPPSPGGASPIWELSTLEFILAHVWMSCSHWSQGWNLFCKASKETWQLSQQEWEHRISVLCYPPAYLGRRATSYSSRFSLLCSGICMHAFCIPAGTSVRASKTIPYISIQ